MLGEVKEGEMYMFEKGGGIWKVDVGVRVRGFGISKERMVLGRGDG